MNVWSTNPKDTNVSSDQYTQQYIASEDINELQKKPWTLQIYSGGSDFRADIY